MIRLAVVFPAPFGPRSATISPGCTSNDTSSRAMVPSKRRVRCRTSITVRAYERYELAFVEVDVVLSLHGRAATALVLYYTAVGLWGLFLGIRNSGPSPGFRGAIAIAVIASVVQGVLGFVVLILGNPPREALHILYGFALALAMPLAASLVRDRAPRGQSVALGFAALFTAGLAIRGIITA